MNRDQIIKITNIICDYLDEKLQDKTGFVEIGTPVPVDSITGYEIASITDMENKIAVNIKFKYDGLLYCSMSRYYYLEKVEDGFELMF